MVVKSPFRVRNTSFGTQKDHPWAVRGRRSPKKVNSLQAALPHQRRELILKKRELQLAEGDPESISSDAEGNRDAWCSWMKTAVLLGYQLETCINTEPVPRSSHKKPEFSDLGSVLRKAAAGCDLQT